jgi:DNA ligase-1
VPIPPLLLGYPWTTQKVKGWWLSEKLDGVRAYWDGQSLLSREGKPLKAPAWFVMSLPAGVTLDGELWAGRGRYSSAMAACKTANHAAWPQMRFAAFDLPGHAGTFEERQAALQAAGLAGTAFVVPQQVCRDFGHLKTELRAVADAGGEGLMLREAGSRYVAGRSHTLLKVRCANNTELLRS